MNGTVAAGGYIEFRIGFKSTYTPTVAYPDRYAVIALQFHDNALTQLIHLRQGEDPDYLMRPGDTNGIGVAVADTHLITLQLHRSMCRHIRAEQVLTRVNLRHIRPKLMPFSSGPIRRIMASLMNLTPPRSV